MKKMSAEEKAIREQDVAWGKAACKKDLDAVVSLYCKDGCLAWAGEPPAQGIAAIRKSWAQMMKIPGLSLEFIPDRIVVSESGELASDFGVVKLGQEDPANYSYTVVSAKYLVVWRKEKSGWKVLYDSYNLNS
jgi:ketosteroid isomerase-like protein